MIYLPRCPICGLRVPGICRLISMILTFMCAQREEKEIHTSLPLFFVCFFVWGFGGGGSGGGVLKEEALKSLSPILQVKKLRLREGQGLGPSHIVEALYCISPAEPELRFPFLACLWDGHKGKLHEIWKVEVEQQPCLHTHPRGIGQWRSPCVCCPPAASPVGQQPDMWPLRTPLDFLLQLLQTLGQVCVQRHGEAGRFCRPPTSSSYNHSVVSPESSFGGLEAVGDQPGPSER